LLALTRSFASLFSRAVHRRLLLSFPTRRSSDLAFVAGQFAELWDGMSPPVQALFGDIAGLEQFQPGVTDGVGGGTEILSEHVTEIGRAPRLNPSQVKRSYDDLCVKKKRTSSGEI